MSRPLHTLNLAGLQPTNFKALHFQPICRALHAMSAITALELEEFVTFCIPDEIEANGLNILE